MRDRALLRLAVIGGCALLAACSNQRSAEDPITVARTVIGQLRSAPPQSAPDPRVVAAVAQDALAKTSDSVAVYALEERKAVAILRPVARNGPHITWASYGSSERRSATTQNGVLSATRGLGNDLMSSRLAPLLDVVARREDGVATIRQRYLDGENKTVTLVSDCEITRGDTETLDVGGRAIPVVRMRAQCWQPERGVDNSYLVDDAGRILESRHWVGPTMGYSTVRLLR